MIDLKDFVIATLRDVVQGIQDAQKIENTGGLIAPGGVGGHEFPKDSGVAHNARIVSTVVKFDVAVTAEAGDAGKVGAGFKVSVFGIGADAGGSTEVSSRNTAVSRIQFSVPIVMPPNPNKRRWHEAGG